MGEDDMMLDKAMEIYSNVPPFPSVGSTSAAAFRSPIPAHRSLSSSSDKRENHGSLKIHPGARVQKASSNPKTTRHNYSFREQKHMAIRRTLRMQRIQRAVADGSFKIRASYPQGDGTSTANQYQGELEQIKRLDQNLVVAALFEPVPGMTFDPAAPWAFNNQADMQDLLQALEAFQMHLARKGQLVLSHRAGPLLRGFARDVLSMVLLRPHRPGREIGVDDFWAQVASDYLQSKKVKWLASRVMKSLQSINGRVSLRTCASLVLDALNAPGKNPKVDEAVTEAIQEMPPFIVAQPYTIRALMGHFEAARVRYLANLKIAHDPRNPSTPVVYQKQNQATGLDNLRRGDGQHDDSSEDEDDGLRGGVFDGGADDDGQVEGGVPSELTQWFLAKLDKWTASKNEQQQEGIDVDMLSALDLGEAKRNHVVM